MKVVVAMDSFKGSMTSREAGNAVKQGILCAMPETEVVVKPLADGGEGTTEALVEGLGGTRIVLSVTGPMGSRTECSYGILGDGKTAVLEIAQAAGITLVPAAQRNPMCATTRGVGEMICDAVQKGCRHFIIGISGSATNDGGIGMLSAMGFRFLDAEGEPVGEGAQALSKVAEILADGVLPELAECKFQIACDVTNPLCGKSGATFIYGPQKGLSLEQCNQVDEGMEHYAGAVETFCGKSCKKLSGAGAAGGLGFAFVSFFDAKLIPGTQLILEAVHLEEELKNAQIVVTGEGRLDAQTAMGKAPIGVAKMAKQYGCKVIALAGEVTSEAVKCHDEGINAFFPIVRGPADLEKAMQKDCAVQNIKAAAEQVFRIISFAE